MQELQQVIRKAGKRQVESFLRKLEGSEGVDKATLELCRAMAVGGMSSYSAASRVAHMRGIKTSVNTLRYKVRKAASLLYRAFGQWDPEECLHAFRKRGAVEVPQGMLRVVSELLRNNGEEFERVMVLRRVSGNGKPRSGAKVDSKR